MIFLIMLQALPTLLAFLEFLLQQFSSIMFFYAAGDLVLMFVPLATPFIAARFSGVAFCASWFVVVFGVGIWTKASRIQICADRLFVQEAAIAVARTQRERGADSSAADGASFTPVVPAQLVS